MAAQTSPWHILHGIGEPHDLKIMDRLPGVAGCGPWPDRFCILSTSLGF